MAERVTVTEAGAHSTEIPDGVSVLPDAVKERAAGQQGTQSTLSGAARRLARLREGRLKSTERQLEPVTFSDETFWIKRLNWSELTRAHLLSGRDKSGQIDITQSGDDLKLLTVGALTVAVMQNELADEPYFAGVGEAVELCEATDLESLGLVSFLFSEVMSRNPGLQPSLIQGVRLAQQMSAGANESSPPVSTTST